MAYLVHYGQLTTGRLTATLPASACTFADELRGVGSFDATVPPGQASGLWGATRGAFSLWAVEWAGNGGRQIVAAGPIYARQGASDGIRYGGSGMYSMLSHRALLDPSWTDAQIPTGVLTWSGVDLGTIIRGIVSTVCADLPITYESSRSGVSTRTYYGYEGALAADRIAEIGAVSAGTDGLGGPDWLLSPQFVAGDPTRIQWALTTGTPSAPWLTPAQQVILDRSAPTQQVLRDVRVSEDSAQLVTRGINLGGGSEGARVVATASSTALTVAGYPRMDATSTSNSLDGPTVAGYAGGLLARRSLPPQAIEVDVDADYWWTNGGPVGTSVRLVDTGNIIGPIDVTTRVLAWKADVAQPHITLTLADTLAQV